MAFSVGEDLFSVLVVVGLVTVFVAALGHFYNIYTERRDAYEDFDLALGIAERLTNQVLADGQSGLLELSHERLEKYSQILAMQGIALRVEVRTPDGELLFAHGPELNSLEQYTSGPFGVSLPTAIATSQGSAVACELLVQARRG